MISKNTHILDKALPWFHKLAEKEKFWLLSAHAKTLHICANHAGDSCAV